MILAATSDATDNGDFWLTQPVATILAAGGAIIAAAIAFWVAALARRQTDRHWETTNRQTRFTTATTQLADPNPAVRIAGVAALEALIDDWLTPPQHVTRIPWHHHLHPRTWAPSDRDKVRQRRLQQFRETPHPQAQAGINVLCAYLRLPATTHPTGDNTITHETTTITRGRTGKQPLGRHIEQTRTYQRDDHEVRNSILRTITNHLRYNPPGQSWQWLDYDFTGAHLDHANLRNPIFRGLAAFDKAQFHGDETSFDEAQFHGEETSFGEAQFHGKLTWFGGAQFHGKLTWFGGAQFHGEETWFGGAQFHGEETWFGGAQFRGEETSFGEAQFHGTGTWFGEAQFRSERTLFDEAQFRSTRTLFDWAQFHGKQTSFDWAQFHSKLTWFGGAQFRSEQTWFGGAQFHSGSIVDFARPAVWMNMHFDWTNNVAHKPADVLPAEWPPQPANDD